MNHKLDTDTQVFFYEQDFYVLSNFAAFNLQWKGLTFPTSEHAYHWEKFYCPDVRRALMEAPSAHEAFKIAERRQGDYWVRKTDWNEIRVDIMRDIVRAKANQHEYVRRKLLATGDRELVEDSWRDDFWGWGPNKDGKNMLGKLWMEIRAELRREQPAPVGFGGMRELPNTCNYKPMHFNRHWCEVHGWIGPIGRRCPAEESSSVLNAVVAERDALLALLAELTYPDPCSYDHHGLCQAHSLGEKPCAHERARTLLAEKGVQV